MKKIRQKTFFLSIVFFVLATLGILHQYLKCGEVWEMSDVHHETFILMFAFSGVLLVVLKYFQRLRKKQAKTSAIVGDKNE